jgi:hypothetical protein
MAIWTLTLLIAINAIWPIGNVRAVDRDHAELWELETVIMQEGAAIPEGGILDGTKPVEVVVSFRVPVAADVDPVEPENPIQHGDTVTFELTDQFRLLSGASKNLQMGPIPVGHVELDTDPDTGLVTATVIFDGDPDVFNGTYNKVLVGFDA